jgi:hypothetical protein
MSVYLLDTNIWLRAVQRESPHHALAVDALAALLARGGEIVVVAPADVLTEYLFTPGVTHAPGCAGVPPASRLRGQAALALGSNVNTYACAFVHQGGVTPSAPPSL